MFQSFRYLPGLCLMFMLMACQDDAADKPATAPVLARADVYLLSTEGNQPRKVGEALLSYQDKVVDFTLSLSGLPAGGQHAVHLHEGSCENPGAHWNGGGSERYCEVPSQGSVWGRPFLGDIGNVAVNAQGSGTLSIKTELWALGDGSLRDVAGTYIMLHEGPENYSMACDPNHGGHEMPANAKIACGEIVLTD